MWVRVQRWHVLEKMNYNYQNTRFIVKKRISKHVPIHQMKPNVYALYLHIDKVKSAERLWHAGDDGPVSRGVIVQLEQRRGNELVVTRHCEVRFLL